MAEIGFVGPSYIAPSIYQDDQECINWRAEIDPALPEGDRNVVALYPTPGLRLVNQLPTIAEVRTLRAVGNFRYLLAVSGAGVYLLNQQLTQSLLIGKLSTSSNVITSCDNSINAYIVDGVNRYTYYLPDSFPSFATFSGTVSGTTLTVTNLISGTIATNQVLTSPNALPIFNNETIIVSGSGNTWTLNKSYTQTTPVTFHSYPIPTVFQGYISGDILYVSNVNLTGKIYLGMTLIGNNVSQEQTIVTDTNVQDTVLTGIGEEGTYRVNYPSTAGTVTNATITNAGSGYTSLPVITVTPPLGAIRGVVARVAATSLTAVSVAIASVTGVATQGQVLTVLGGTAINNNFATLQVTSVDASGLILAVAVLNGGAYSNPPSNPVSVLELSGNTFTLGFGLGAVEIDYAGSGYTSTPMATVTGGGGTSSTLSLTVAPLVSQGQMWGLPFTVLPDTDGPFDDAVGIDIVDNTFIYSSNQADQLFAQSDILSPLTNGASSIAKDSSPDPTVGIKILNRDVFVFGQHTTEVWVNTGPAELISTTTLQKLPGATSQEGTIAFNTVARTGNSLAYLSSNLRGSSQVVLLNGYIPQRISTHAVENSIANQIVTDAFAFTYQLAGHECYVITFPSINLTWVYDLATQLWHKWLRWDEGSSTFMRHRSNCAVQFNDKVLIGDYLNGKLYELRVDQYTDDGEAIHRLRRTPHLVADYKQTYVSALQIYFASGLALPNRNPRAMLRWSNNGGASWSQEYWQDVVQIGNYTKRAIWRRLGQSRDKVLELRVSDPIQWVVVSSEAVVEAGDH